LSLSHLFAHLLLSATLISSACAVLLFFLIRPTPPTSTLFPYTTLFRSWYLRHYLAKNRHDEATHHDPRLSPFFAKDVSRLAPALDRKSTRLNSSHEWISYAVFCLKKKKKKYPDRMTYDRIYHTRLSTRK